MLQEEQSRKIVDQLSRSRGSDAMWVYLGLATAVLLYALNRDWVYTLVMVIPALTAVHTLERHRTIGPMAREIKRLRELLEQQQSESGLPTGSVVES